MGKYLSSQLYHNKNLPKGKYFFKFIVDSQWYLSSDYPQACDEEGNLNNFIDTRDHKNTFMLSEIDTLTYSFG